MCRWGVFGLSREYFPVWDEPAIKNAESVIDLEVPPARLRAMQAVITTECNLRCEYCSFFANAPAAIKRRMSGRELENICQVFNKQIGQEGLLLITGGEPELYREAVDFLLENIEGKVIIFTNGTLIDECRLEYYQRFGAGVLFSLDGDLLAHDSMRHRGNKGSFSRVDAALRAARESGLDYGISMVVGEHNIERLPGLVKDIHDEYRPASFGLNLPHVNKKETWRRIEEYTNALIEIFVWAKENGVFIDQINRRLTPLIQRSFRFRDCSAQGEKMVFWPGGVTTSCVNQAGLDGRVIDWENRIPILKRDCLDCCAIGICGGGCVFDGEAIYGAGEFDERNCYFTRKMLEFMVWEFRDELGDDANNTESLVRRYSAMIDRNQGTLVSVGHET